MSHAVLTLNHLSVGYPGPQKTANVIVSNLHLSLQAGELVCLLGPNGAGKSTLLRTVAAMQKPLAGEVQLAGRNVQALSKMELARKMAVVLTERITVGLLTAYEVVALGRTPYTNWSGTLKEEDHTIVGRALQEVGATSLATHYVSELSDGERQKVMVARALAQQPQLMILDEITAFLDLPRRVEIMRILQKLAHQRGCAILLSTHDLELALSTADRVWLLPKGGPLVAGAPEDLVLRGQFAAAFASEGVEFDEEAGSFTTHGLFHSEVTLTGVGPLARWTRRALERKGYRVYVESGLGRSLVKAMYVNNRATWEVVSGNQIYRHASIEELLHMLPKIVEKP